MEARTPALHLDPVAESNGHLISIVFLKSPSRSYEYAVSIARNADKYAEADISGKPVHYTVFHRTPEGTARALALLDLVKNWAGTQLFAGGQLQPDAYRVFDVLRCYQQALRSNDPKAHCEIPVENPFRGGIGDCMTIEECLDVAGRLRGDYITHIFPCRFVGFMILRPGNNPSPENQIQSEAVRRGCDWCPLLRVEAFRKIK